MNVSRVTLLTPSPDRYLIAASDARTRLGLASTDDSLIAELLLEAGSMIEHYLGRPLARQRYTEALPGLDDKRVFLSRLPVDPDSVTVSVDGESQGSFEIENLETGQLYLANGWPCGDEQDVSVTYYAGYLLPGRVSDWSSGAKAAGAWCRPTVLSTSRLRFECTTAGTTAGSEPAWASYDGGETITDGTVTWTARDAQELPPELSSCAWLAVRNLWDVRTRPAGLTRMDADGFSESYAANSSTDLEMPEYLKNALRRWKYT